MRAFEVALIVVNLFALFLGTREKQTKNVLLGLAVSNWVVLGLHGAIEGFRYSMSFSYAFVFLFTIYALLRSAIKIPETKWIKLLKNTGIGLSLIFLAITSLLAYVLPVFKLPAPTGEYAVGVQYFYPTDERRLEPFLKDSTEKRQLAVKIYYPATEDKSKPKAAYFHGSHELVQAFASGYRLPRIMFDQVRLVETHSRERLSVSEKQTKYPVVLFSHGGGTLMETHTSQCEDLASQGYVVVAVNHTYVSSATELPDGIVTDRDATASFDDGDPLDAITQIMADDNRYMIDLLTDMNAGETESIFAGKLDLERIGVVGHSLGGAAAYNLAISDSRVKAALNLDGAVYAVPDASKPKAAFLMLANDEFGIQAIAKREPLMKKWEDMSAEEQQGVASAYGSEQAYIGIYKKQEQAINGLADTLKASDSLFAIEGSAHMKMADIGLYIGPGFRSLIGINGATSSEECLEIAKAATLAFLDQHLKNGQGMESVLGEYPKLHRVKLP